MKTVFPNMFRHLLNISPEEASFAKRGFTAGNSAAVKHLEEAGKTFLEGYKFALASADLSKLEENLEQIEIIKRGFAYEGAAMAITLVDALSPWRGEKITTFLKGRAEAHIYMVHVGIGWALARLPWKRLKPLQSINRLNPLLKWLVIDGFGFHQGYFYPRSYFKEQASFARLPNYCRHAFAQGLGRSLWFVEAANIFNISQTVSKFPADLHGDLWSGVALACAYAGGAGDAPAIKLRLIANDYLPQIAQGAAFAAKTRLRAGNPAVHTERACQILCRLSINDAASVTDTTLKDLPQTDDIETPDYEIWRRRIQEEFTAIWSELELTSTNRRSLEIGEVR